MLFCVRQSVCETARGRNTRKLRAGIFCEPGFEGLRDNLQTVTIRFKILYVFPVPERLLARSATGDSFSIFGRLASRRSRVIPELYAFELRPVRLAGSPASRIIANGAAMNVYCRNYFEAC